MPVFAVAAIGLGARFPLLSHYAIPPDQYAGARLSYLYVGNVLGATAGSFVTGLWLLDLLSLRVLNLCLVILGIGMSGLLTVVALRGRHVRVAFGTSYVVLAALLTWSSPALYAGIYERLFYQGDYYDWAAVCACRGKS